MNRAAVAVLLLLAACAGEVRSRASVAPEKLSVPGCENVYRLTAKLISGGEPHDEDAFRALAALGVRTIISVDGAKPDAALAAKHGMRYVHLPVAYDGIPRPRILEVARAIRDLEGPTYIHCHHGLHRGPAAAAAALVALGECGNETGVSIMKALGTSPTYPGLYESVSKLAATPADVDRASAEFPAAAALPGFTASMALVDRRFEHLQDARKSGWKPSPDHPDIEPAHEALQFRELFAELNRTPYVKSKPEAFRKWMTDTESDAGALEKAIRYGDAVAAEGAWKRIEANCKACHAEHRNKPRK
jgi:protein tyrosine phosphatase (PTP) superfamily phosphohydrolase (DUF442 family)